MCEPNQEYQYINPNTQVALFSDCVDQCKFVSDIQWNIYQGSNDTSTNIVEWTEFIHLNSSQDLHFFGKKISLINIFN
jgi:hypothetical protein